MGFADIAALMEFHANNPTAPNKPVAVMMVYNNTPAAVLALKKSGIKAPKDLDGKKLGAPVFDAGRRAFPIFAKANGVGSVAWTSMDPTLRETMLARGDVDAITGFSFTSLLNLEARGVKADDVVVLPYPSYGVKLYGNAIIVSEPFLQKNPEAVKALVNLAQLLVRAARVHPDRPAVLRGERLLWRYRELADRVARLAGHLRALGLAAWRSRRDRDAQRRRVPRVALRRLVGRPRRGTDQREAARRRGRLHPRRRRGVGPDRERRPRRRGRAARAEPARNARSRIRARRGCLRRDAGRRRAVRAHRPRMALLHVGNDRAGRRA
jgi:hypothetical protein